MTPLYLNNFLPFKFQLSRVFLQFVLFCIGMNPVFANDEYGEDASLLAPDSSDEELETDDLTSTQKERRQEVSHGVQLMFGEAVPFSSIGVRYVRWASHNHAVSVSASTGRYRYKTSSNNQEVTSTSNGLVAGYDFLPLQDFPLALTAKVGVNQWSFRGQCVSGENTGACRHSNASALGGTLSGGLAFSWMSEKNLTLDWCVICVRTAFMSKIKVEDHSSAEELQDATKKYHNRLKMMSVANFAVGYAF